MMRRETRSNFIHGLLLWWDNWGAPLSVNLPAMADVQNVEHVAQIINDDPVVPDAKPPESRAAEFCRVVREAARVPGDLLNFVLNEARILGGPLQSEERRLGKEGAS